MTWRNATWPIVLGTLIAAGVFLRLWQLPGQILADDEWHALNTLLAHDAGYVFRHFGRADHCIPLTLYYLLLANSIGLSEWAMRLPLLIAGIATLIAVPWMLRDLLVRHEQQVLAILLALSPLAIYYSRTARPYALSVLLSFIALWALTRWWRTPDMRWGGLYIACTALAAWLHPISLAFTGAGLLFVGSARLIEARRIRSWRPVLHTLALGALTLLPTAALLGPPVANDWSALSGKTGEHVIQPETLLRSLELLAGTPSSIVALLWLALGIYGATQLWRRDARLTAFWCFVISLPPIVIAITNAAWIHHALVFTRYNLLVLPVFSAFVAVGLLASLTHLGGARLPLALILILIGFAAGPIPQLLPSPNQFTGHMSYQFDYNFERNVYNRFREHESIPAFYHTLGQAPRGSLTVIESPWHHAWHFNHLHFYQTIHRQNVMIGFVNGLCSQERNSEYPAVTSRQIDMRHFVQLSTLTPDNTTADYLVLHRSLPNNAPQITDMDSCIGAMQDRFGVPVYDDEEIVVYHLINGSAPASNVNPLKKESAAVVR